MGGAPDDESTSVEFALAGLEMHRHASESAWPYGCPKFPSARPTPHSALDLSRLPPWHQLPLATGFDDVAAVVTAGVAVILTLEHNHAAWLAAHDSGVVDAPPGSKIVARHAVLVVGVDRSQISPFFIIKNSWGSDWAQDGYAQLSRRYFENYISAIHTLGA